MMMQSEHVRRLPESSLIDIMQTRLVDQAPLRAQQKVSQPVAYAQSRLQWPQKFRVLRILVSATSYHELTQVVIQAGKARQPSVVSCHAVHAVVTASDSVELTHKVNTFEAITPDGQPVKWALRWLHRVRLKDRVYGPEFMMRVCEAAANENIGVYLYGGTPEVLEKLKGHLWAKFPLLKLDGEAPPFRPLTPEEDRQVVNRIADSGAGIVFIGLGCPKQDEFAYDHRDRISAVQICVGAAFDFHAGVKPMAPGWMQRLGLEWLFRLIQEPRRLWRRYAYTNSRYLYLLFRQLIRNQKSADYDKLS